MVEGKGESLEDFLEGKVFRNAVRERMDPVPAEVDGFSCYLNRFISGLAVEKVAIESL